jgi:ABC-type lipoprotein export system ATPase subunit
MESISIKINNLLFYYEEESILFNNLSYCIKNKSKIGICGPSGSGKSTLLALITGMLKPKSGDIIWEIDNKKYLNEQISFIRSKKSSFMLQHHFLLDYLTAEENILLAIDNKPSKNDRENCIKLIKQLGLEKCYKRFPKQLSGGEKQRVSLGRALINKKNFIFVDEPTARLDRKHAKEISDLLINVLEDQTVIIATHDEYILKKCDKTLKIDKI